MKLNDIQRILQDNISKLDFESRPSTVGNQTFLDFNGLNPFRNALTEIESTGLLTTEIKTLHSSPLFTTYKDNLRINVNEGNNLVQLTDQLKTIANGILESLNSVAVPHKENSITIKLPNDVNDFDSLAKVSGDLQMILSQAIINPHINGEIKIQSVENGSIWIEVYVGTAAALTLVASLTWSAMVIYKKMQDGKIFHEYAEGLKIKNQSLEEMQQAQKEHLDMLIDAEANNLYNEHFNNNDNEQIGRLKYSIKMLAELIDRGAEVHPALNTPETVSNLFPDKENLALIGSKIKKLEGGN